MDDGVKKIAALTAAKEKYQQAIQIEIDSTKDQLKNAKATLDLMPLSVSAQNEVVELIGQLNDLYSEQESGIRMITRQIATEQKKLFDDVFSSINKFNSELDKQLDSINKEIEDRAQKEADEVLKIQTEFYEKDAKVRKYWADKAKKDAEKEITPMDILKERTENAQEEIGKAIEDAAKRSEQVAKEEAQAKQYHTDKEKAGKMQAMDEAVRLAMITSDLVLSISTNQMNRELAMLERKKQGLLEIASINGLTKEEELFILEQTEAQKLEIEKKYRLQRQRIAIAQATIDGAAAIAKTFAEYGGLPIAWIIAALVAAQIAVQIGIIKSQKFAKGGWTGDGTDRDETGERVAGVVHEKEFVVKRGQASKYREVLEAINRDDRKAIYNNFTKLEPEFASPVNNVTVENSGPNNRLDRINSQLYQLNRTMSPKKTQREEMMVNGSTVVIRKGNSVRVIKR